MKHRGEDPKAGGAGALQIVSTPAAAEASSSPRLTVVPRLTHDDLVVWECDARLAGHELHDLRVNQPLPADLRARAKVWRARRVMAREYARLCDQAADVADELADMEGDAA